jgi:secreted trypsin-like serine protease
VKIIGGTDVNTKEEFPYMVSLTRKTDNIHICGGAIISDQHILTAGHCLHNKLIPHTDIVVLIGSNIFSSLSENTYEIMDVFIHSGFTGIPDAENMSLNDIAIAKVH